MCRTNNTSEKENVSKDKVTKQDISIARSNNQIIINYTESYEAVKSFS